MRQSQELQIANLNDLIKGLLDSTERTRAEGKDEGLTEGRALGRKEMEEEMEKQLEERYNQGYWQAKKDAAEQILEAQAEMKEAQHKEGFMLSYIKGLDDAGVGPEDERRASVEVPPLVIAGAGAEEPNVSGPEATNDQAPVDDPVQSPSATPSPDA